MGRYESVRGFASVDGNLSPLRRYGCAVLFVLVAMGATFLLRLVFTIPFWFSFLAAVMASSWFGGTGPGWLAVILSTVAVDRFFLPPAMTGQINREAIPFLFAFVGCALIVSWFSSWRTQVERSLKEARDQLEARVRERTSELQEANDSLVVEISERKRAQEASAVAQAALARVNRVMTIGELTASIAHEVSQPLAAILTSAGACDRWLANDPPDIEKARVAAARITKAGTRASEVVSGTRALFKKGKPETRSININDVIRETVSLLQDEAARQGISIDAELDSDLPATFGDPVHLQQVIMNLMMNGIDAMEAVKESSGVLHLMTRRLATNEVLVTVQDSGSGLDPGNLETIFHPYFTTKEKGLGMGLSISRSIVESHGGRLWATPGANRGAIFQFTLPAKVAPLTDQTTKDSGSDG
jgi:C4-dicarboxylate-specific signal transduction histidine kinase